MENKIKIDGYIVVEGKSDVDFLSSIIESNFIMTNGSEISQQTLDLIKNLKNKGNKIIILTDPDTPGEMIRNKINNYIEGCYNCFLNKENCIKKNKVGVAEADRNEVILKLKDLKLLDNYFKYDENIKLKDLLNLNITNQKTRNYLSNYFNFDYCNNKLFIKRINQLHISLNDLKKAMEEMK